MSTLKFTVEENKIRLDKFLAGLVKDISRSKIQKDIIAGAVSINGKMVDSSKTIVKKDDKVAYIPIEEQKPGPVNIPLVELYNQDQLLILDKPAGLAMHPGAGLREEATLAQALLFHYPKIKNVGQEDRHGIVHRLDKETSGVILVALSQDMYDHLKNSFSKKTVKKEYLALVCGNIPKSHGFIERSLGKSKRDFRKYTTDISDMVREKPSLTEYSVVEHLTYSPNNSASGIEFISGREQLGKEEAGDPVFAGSTLEGGNTPRVSSSKVTLDEYTLIVVKLHTGRMHQIRVHFNSIGFPLVGDKLYGGKQAIKLGFARQALHAKKIAVQLPDTSWVEGESKVPQDFRQLLEKLSSKKVKNL